MANAEKEYKRHIGDRIFDMCRCCGRSSVTIDMELIVPNSPRGEIANTASDPLPGAHHASNAIPPTIEVSDSAQGIASASTDGARDERAGNSLVTSRSVEAPIEPTPPSIDPKHPHIERHSYQEDEGINSEGSMADQPRIQ